MEVWYHLGIFETRIGMTAHRMVSWRASLALALGSLANAVDTQWKWTDFRSNSLYFFSNAMTAYRKLPFAYPLLIARKACRKAMPSRPWLKAKAHSEGFCTSDHEMSLGNTYQQQFVSGGGGGVDRGTHTTSC